MKTFGLTLKQQWLYIDRLEELLDSDRDLNDSCPAMIKELYEDADGIVRSTWVFDPKLYVLFKIPWNCPKNATCNFCVENVGSPGGCPCRVFGVEEARRRGRDFIRRFRLENPL